MQLSSTVNLTNFCHRAIPSAQNETKAIPVMQYVDIQDSLCPTGTFDHVDGGHKLSSSMRKRIPLFGWGMEVTVRWGGRKSDTILGLAFHHSLYVLGSTSHAPFPHLAEVLYRGHQGMKIRVLCRMSQLGVYTFLFFLCLILLLLAPPRQFPSRKFSLVTSTLFIFLL